MSWPTVVSLTLSLASLAASLGAFLGAWRRLREMKRRRLRGPYSEPVARDALRRR